MKLSDDITSLKGIGKKTSALYNRLGIFTVKDLLSYYPRDYERYEPTRAYLTGKVGEIISVYCRVKSTPTIALFNGMKLISCKLVDERGTVFIAKWYNQPYLRSTLKTGSSMVLRGKLVLKRGQKFMEQPQIFSREQYSALTKKLLPVYPLTKGISRTSLMKSVKQALEKLYEISETEDLSALPSEIESKYKMMSFRRALEEIHFPSQEASYIRARNRIVFDEFFCYFINMYELKRKLHSYKNPFPYSMKKETDELTFSLPYSLTGSQLTALLAIRKEMSGPNVMYRLLQGDVGSGKTIVAFLAMYEAVLNGYQAALMAPTEVLAMQHYRAFESLIKSQESNVKAALLTGDIKAAKRREILKGIASHEIDVVIGTHALFQEMVEFKKLSLVVVDEEHRFGVNQRKLFRKKGGTAHMLSMSATPIPRSLASILYAGMDVSMMEEKPVNRLPIKSCVVDSSYRKNAYALIRRELTKGHQAYIICPFVEESELMKGENVTDYGEEMKRVFGADAVGILHGRMTAQEKQRVMLKFSKGDIKLLVSTTVVEVGVDVKNATVIMIEDAQRYGLAQLHQLRGRVGRGDAQSYCIFVNTDENQDKNERLQVMVQSNDGFLIASEDLRLRGPGDLFGVRQSGELEFKLADIYKDTKIMEQAALEAAAFKETLA